jgi:hypothetical protein
MREKASSTLKRARLLRVDLRPVSVTRPTKTTEAWAYASQKDTPAQVQALATEASEGSSKSNRAERMYLIFTP